ncbi:hypothetical protein [Vacuolonema iberomarrocanum]|uniref:hypothetical protein n=1 Tax=Vacuolonema iberomarrocanum TaxID=3454632 RepID=UPI0019EB8694|nr:hypothetical protein [filamentous cyanobacterium LEGE 07170]
MLQPTRVTWILIIFGVVTLAPLVLAQLTMLAKPHSQKAKDFLVAKGADWRDKTHFRSALGCAWADWILLVPLVLFGSVGVLWGHDWGYVLWGAAGSISLYINIVLWFMEKEYVYPSRGSVAYYTYYWGFFILWGSLALAYSALRLGGFDF